MGRRAGRPSGKWCIRRPGGLFARGSGAFEVAPHQLYNKWFPLRSRFALSACAFRPGAVGRRGYSVETNSEEIIVGRALKAIENNRRIALGPGIPQELTPFLPQGTSVIRLNGVPSSAQIDVDVAVVEADEVNPQGDLAVSGIARLDGVRAGRWIVATRLNRQDGTAKIVRESRLPVSREKCVGEIITEWGLIRVEPFGFALKEVAPGASSDDVRRRVEASLHVADDLRVMDLG